MNNDLLGLRYPSSFTHYFGDTDRSDSIRFEDLQVEHKQNGDGVNMWYLLVNDKLSDLIDHQVTELVTPQQRTNSCLTSLPLGI